MGGDEERIRRRGQAPGHPPGFRQGQPVRLPGMRRCGLSGLRQRGKDLAAPELLSARSLPACAGAAGHLQGLRDQAGIGPLGAAGQRLYAAVRGLGHGHGASDAGGRCRADGRRVGHQAVAGHPPLRRGGSRPRRSFRRHQRRLRRDGLAAWPQLCEPVRRSRPPPRSVRRRGQRRGMPPRSMPSPRTWRRMAEIPRPSPRCAST